MVALAVVPATGERWIIKKSCEDVREGIGALRGWWMVGAEAMPLFFLILACALWGLSFPVVKALHLEQTSRLPGVGSEFLAAWIQVARFGLGALILLPFAWRRGWPTRLEWRQGMWLACWGGLGMVVQADGLAHTDASTSAFLTQAYCVILPWVADVDDEGVFPDVLRSAQDEKPAADPPDAVLLEVAEPAAHFVPDLFGGGEARVVADPVPGVIAGALASF
jgi:hypothetical protein